MNSLNNSALGKKRADGKNDPPRVFLMTDQLRVGGTERQFVAHTNSINRDFFQVQLGCLQKCGPFLESLGEITEFNPGGSFLGKRAFQSYRKLGRHLREHRVSVAHSFDFYSNVMLIPVARIVGVPVVIGSFRSMGDRFRPAQFAVLAILLQLCDAVVCNSYAAAKRLVECGVSGDKAVVIGNGLSKEAFAEAQPALAPSAGLMRVGMIGRMNEAVKNHTLFLRAAANLAQTFPNLEFILAGDGDLRPSLEKLARELKIEKRVRFLGERHDIPAVLASLDISVVPSLSESLSNVIMESMAAGKPVVASNVGGNAELVHEGETGRLVSPHDPKELAGAIARLLENSALRKTWGQNARAIALANFGLESVRDRYENLYLELLRAKGEGKQLKSRASLRGIAQSELRVAIVAPSTRKLGGQSVQADLLMRSWQNDPELEALFVPTDPALPGWLSWVERVPYLRTIVRAPFYLASLWRAAGMVDTLHIFSASYWSFLVATAPAWFVARMRGKKSIINYRSGEAPDHLAHSRTALAILRRASRIVVPSSYLVRVFRENGLQATIVPNLVDVSQFSYRLRKPLKPNLVCARSLEPYYRVDLVVRAFARVREEFPEAHLCIVGDGSMRTRISDLIRTLGLTSVQFAGNILREQIGRFYDQADIFVNASSVDNMPVSLLEAFASGTPVVSSAPDGIRAIVDHEQTGLLSAPGDWQSLAANVIRLLREPDLALRLVENAHEQSREYSWEPVRAKWLETYRSLKDPIRAETANAPCTPKDSWRSA
jgi:glycosyltransferase involved in cell wall biosynthesis